MIPLTPGRDRRGRRRHGCTTPTGDELVTGDVEFDSRRSPQGGLFVALPGERVDGHDFAAAAVAAGAVGVLAAREVDAPAVIVPPVADEHPASVVLTGDTTAPAPPCWPRWPSSPGMVVDRSPTGPDRGRGDRLLGQDLHQGPDRAAADPARGRPSRRRGRSTTSSATRGPCCAPTRRPGTWCWSCPPAGIGHIAALCRDRAAADRRRAQRRHARTSASSAPARASRRPRASWSRRCRAADGGRDPQRRRPAGRRHGRAAPRPGSCWSASTRTPTCAPRTSRWTTRPAPPSRWSPRPGRRRGHARPARRAPGRQRAGRRRGRARTGRDAAGGRRAAPRRAARVRRAGWRSPTGPTA